MKSKLDIEKLRGQLPHGALTKIATKANVTLQTVHYVINGKSKNLKVMNAIADYLQEFKDAEQRLSSLIE